MKPAGQTKNGVNQSAQYHGVEKYVHDRIAEGETVYFRAEPWYSGTDSIPYEIHYIVITPRTGSVHFIIQNVP